MKGNGKSRPPSEDQVQAAAIRLLKGKERIEEMSYDMRLRVAELLAEKMNMELREYPEPRELPNSAQEVEMRRMGLYYDYDKSKKALEEMRLLDYDYKGRTIKRPVPPFSHIVRQFSGKEISVAQSFKEPTLVLLPPGKNFFELLEAAQKYLHDNDRQTMNVVDFYEKTEPKRDLPEDFRAAIIEGSFDPGAQPGEDLRAKVQDRVAMYREQRPEQQRGMDRELYLAFLITKIHGNRLPDDRSITILDDDPGLNDFYVPLANCHNGRPNFYWSPNDISLSALGRLRPSVGGQRPIDGGLGVGFRRRLRELMA